MNLLFYILEANCYLVIIYSIYWLVLRTLRFHVLNRFYLLGGTIISFIVPLLNFSSSPAPVTVEFSGYSPAAGSAVAGSALPSLDDTLTIVYLVGLIFMSLIFIRKLYYIKRMTTNKRKVNHAGVRVIYIKGLTQPFSFFKSIYLPENSSPESEAIVMSHELMHTAGRHSVDLVILEIIKIISWFIPFVYVIQREVKLIHEYIADGALAGKKVDLDSYIMHLLYYGGKVKYNSLASGLNCKELLSNRIQMMYKGAENPNRKLMYLIPVFLFPMFVFASSAFYKKDYGLNLGNLPQNGLSHADPLNASLQNPDDVYSVADSHLRRDTLIKEKRTSPGGKTLKQKPQKKNDQFRSFPVTFGGKIDTVKGENGDTIVIQSLTIDTSRSEY